ncbi:alpha/beta hydrolase [Phenylobacterium sp.]|uniref:alpha/beta hydrolase n=1 Tax=Phenylobacterium sp. TaxID=1871053 RepID=UPI00286DDA10|nr:alpha/beta hydrolase [Phenylobacterium sp.]
MTHPLRLGLAAATAALTAACSPLTMFSTLTPKDPATRADTGVAYGPLSRQKLDVYAPRKSTALAPVAVFFYGGSWDSGRRQDYRWVGQALAAQGYLTIVPDYRIFPEVTYPSFLEDGAAAVRWAADHAKDLGGDPRRIVLVGHSAGAYNAVMLGFDTRYLQAQGVDPKAIRAVAGLSGPYDFIPIDGPVTRRTFGGAADLAATQPSQYASRSGPAAFLATGDADRTVYPRNTKQLAAAIRAAGGQVEEKHYAGVDHAGSVLALSRPFRNRAPILADMTAFLDGAAK